jgi:hypothetical protein
MLQCTLTQHNKGKINKMKKVIKIDLDLNVYYEKKRLKTYVLRKELSDRQ